MTCLISESIVIKENSSVEQLQVSSILMQTTDTFHSNKMFTDITTSLSEKVSSHMSMTCNDVMKQYNILSHKFVLALSYWKQLAMATNCLSSVVVFLKEWQVQTVAPYTCMAEF